MKRTIKIHIAGQPYQVRSDADESYVQGLADHVNARVGAVLGGLLGTLLGLRLALAIAVIGEFTAGVVLLLSAALRRVEAISAEPEPQAETNSQASSKV